ncbi:chemotaxis protein [Herminiimonas fonticola]|uniref:chemotaxis protein n=1 Tax=Herminiimonas fonticola TaxID=303380 RepID=UPI003342698C
MTIEISLAGQVRHLLSGLSEHGGQHLTEIETDLVQTNILLGEAIEKLSASFMAIHATVTAQQQIVDALLAGTAVTPDAMLDLREQAAQIDQHVNAAVTGLQFQDMTTQLINRTVRRVVGLRDVLEVLGANGSAIPADGNGEQMHAALSEVNARLKAQSVELEKELWKAVRQTHMESGEIDLF